MHRPGWAPVLAFLALASSSLLAPTPAAAHDTEPLLRDQVRERGELICGTNGVLWGFGYMDPNNGKFTGFDVDFCRAVAAAVLGDADAVEYKHLGASARLPALAAGEVDVLIRNTTFTLSRDTQFPLDFGPTTFYDGQGFMVRADSGISDLAGVAQATICVQVGTTTHLNVALTFPEAETLLFPDSPTAWEAYLAGQCDSFTTDRSGLAAFRLFSDDPEAHVLLDETISKEPLGPVVREGDDNWADIIRWTVYCTISAEEYGVTSANVDESFDDPFIQIMLGQLPWWFDPGQAMGLEATFCRDIIEQVGNYGEIYERNLLWSFPPGQQKREVHLPRGVNTPHTEGGLLYSPPFR